MVVVGVLSLFTPLGFVIGYVYPIFFVGNQTGTEEELRSKIFLSYLLQAIITGIFLVLIIFTFINNPIAYNLKNDNQTESENEIRSTKYESQKIENPQIPFFTQIKILIKDPTYICLVIAGGYSFGATGSLGSVTSEIFSILQYPQILASIISTLGIIFGLIASIGYSIAFLSYNNQIKML